MPAMTDAPATEARHAALRALCADGRVIDLAEAALLLSAERRPGVALQSHREFLARLVAAVEAALGAGGLEGTPPQALRQVLGGRFGFKGDNDTYEDLQNADFARVLDRRKGLPIALGILYIHVARALGFGCVGLNFPGHFVIRLDFADARGGAGRAILDPFHGGIARDPADLRRLYRELRGPEAEIEPQHFAAVADADVLLRLQNNIKLRLLQQENGPAALQVLQSMLLIAPERPELWYEAGLIGAQAERVGFAVRALERFLELVPAGVGQPDGRYRAAQLLQSLKRRLN
jgi:regulator of sirC expression with transglutaminase-like and TPR domain